MNTIFPSQTLADMLILNGFEETTQQEWPAHFQRFQGKIYNPYTAKRTFRIGGRRGPFIYFHYINIFLERGKTSFGIQLSSKYDLKALIAYIKLNNPDQESLLYLLNNPRTGPAGKVRMSDFVEIIKEMKEDTNSIYHRKVAYSRFKEAFDNVIIN